MSVDLDALALRLHDFFVVGGRIHLLQQPDGQYCAIRRRLSVGRIHKMLESGESIAAFQFCGGMTRWICLDFDLHRDYLVTTAPQRDLSSVLETTQRCSYKLRNLGLKHLVEYSGNRGFHIWVLLSERIDRTAAYRLLEAILVQCELEGDLRPVKIDRYPASPNSRSTRGRGVKIPLSKHVKSGSYSYVVADIDGFDLGRTLYISELTSAFVAEQLTLLDTSIVCSREEPFKVLGLQLPRHGPEILSPTYLRSSLQLRATEVPTLDEVLRCLRKCKCVDGLLRELETGTKPNEDTRVVLVGMLARLGTSDRPQFGLDLLHEFFATMPGYDRVRTEEKLRDLSRLYPPTCEQLRSRFPQFFCDCDSESDARTSPVQYLSELGVEIFDVDPFNLGVAEAHAVRIAQQGYTKENDEVPLYWTERELERLSDAAIRDLCRPADFDYVKAMRFHEFQRIEAENSTRRLIALSAADKIWTAAGTLILNDLVYQGFSENSYGYKILPQYIGGRIFQHWLRQWKEFTSHLGELVYAPEYAEWGLLKIDIKSFYDSIDIERLRIKLYDGPTPSLRRLYRTFNPGIRDKYRRIIDQLVDACQVTTRDAHGVPQGPAFARFLAEVYLMDFDAFVENHSQVAPGHYARYVDDIFVITPPSANLASIEAEVLHYIGTLGLRQNPDKHFRGRVKDYRGAFAEYWQDTKYFIDQVSRRYTSAPADEVRRAARELYSLVDTSDGVELNIEHLSFLYTHLVRDPSMTALRCRIEEFVLGLREGRGSLFNNFFGHFLSTWADRRYEFDPKLAEIDGLRKECFLNILLSTLSKSPIEDEDALERIRRVVDTITRKSQSRLETELGAALRLHDARVAGPHVLTDLSSSTLVCLAAHNYPKSIPEDVEARMRHELLKLELAPFVYALSDIIFSETKMNPEFLGQLLGDFRSKAMDAVREAAEAQSHLSFLDPAACDAVDDLRDRYYQLCCLSSVSAPSPAEPNAVLDMIWSSLLCACSEFHNPPAFTSRWVAKLEALHLDDILVNVVLTRGVSDAVQGQRDQHEIFREFHQQLTLDQMGILEDGEQHSHASVTSSVGDQVRNAVRKAPERWPLLHWVFNKTPPPKYAPRREECLANIAANGITILRSGREVLVRRPRDYAPAQSFDYLEQYSLNTDQLQGGRFVCETFQVPVEGFLTVDNFFTRATDGLLGFIGSALHVRNGAAQFAENHRPIGTSHMPNTLATDARIRESDCFPWPPQLVLGRKLVIPQDGGLDQLDNSLSSYDKALYRKISQCGRTLLSHTSHLAEISAEQLDTRLLATFESASEKLAFLSAVHGRWKEMSLTAFPDAFEMEVCKAAAICELMDATAPQQVAPSEMFFARYLGLRQEAKRHFEYQLLLSPTDEADLSTIARVYATLKSSVARTCESVGSLTTSRQIEEFLNADLQRLNEKLRKITLNGFEPPDIVDFREGIVSIDPYRGGLILDGKQIQGPDPEEDDLGRCLVLEVTYPDRDFQRLDAARHQMLENAGSRVYHLHWQDRLLLVVLPRGVYKAATVVHERTREFREIVEAGPREQRKRWCYSNRKSEAEKLQALQGFDAAVSVVASNHPTMKKLEAQRHLEDWLLHMPESQRELLTRVISAHEPIDENHEKHFVERIRGLAPETIVFSLTQADDVCGWHRLLVRKDETLARRIIGRVSEIESKLAAAVRQAEPYEIAIITDIVVSGTQIMNALREHYLAGKTNLELMARRHYFGIRDRTNMSEGIRKCGRLRIIAARYTENGARKLKDPKEGVPNLVNIRPESIILEGVPIPLDRCFLYGNGLESSDQDTFKNLIQDMTFVRRTFQIDGQEEEVYGESVSDRHVKGTGRPRIDFTNLLTRRGTVPKGCARIFRLQLSSGHPSLFECIREHGEVRE